MEATIKILIAQDRPANTIFCLESIWGAYIHVNRELLEYRGCQLDMELQTPGMMQRYHM